LAALMAGSEGEGEADDQDGEAAEAEEAVAE
jgi:hypothetical protein